ncbi:MAG: helix-turn-helix transcriptional regulator [Candidatus Moranbacteria bacterium]|nr:helix-turn-helix transcriptional regulator [Candidatus Moranbacteria bacterium]MBP9801350.1 helix-turn-helix transcriptional regulator [Candidatus Moranbacteria bacterium]
MQETVENTIENMRRKKGLTQEELASAVDVTRQTIIALEKGNYTPSVLLALKIARFFRLPVEKIFTLKF